MQYQGFVLRDITEIKDTQAWKDCYQVAISVLDFGIIVPEITHFAGLEVDLEDLFGLKLKFREGSHHFYKEFA